MRLPAHSRLGVGSQDGLVERAKATGLQLNSAACSPCQVSKSGRHSEPRPHVALRWEGFSLLAETSWEFSVGTAPHPSLVELKKWWVSLRSLVLSHLNTKQLPFTSICYHSASWKTLFPAAYCSRNDLISQFLNFFESFLLIKIAPLHFLRAGPGHLRTPGASSIQAFPNEGRPDRCAALGAQKEGRLGLLSLPPPSSSLAELSSRPLCESEERREICLPDCPGLSLLPSLAVPAAQAPSEKCWCGSRQAPGNPAHLRSFPSLYNSLGNPQPPTSPSPLAGAQARGRNRAMRSLY